MNAVNPLTQLIAAKRMQQTLRKNANDIGALVTLAAFLKDDPELKRKTLNRILSLDPVNKPARDMLLEMDRAEIIGGSTQSILAVPILQAPIPAPGHSLSDPLEKPLVFRYSIIPRVLMYPVMVLSVFALFLAIQMGEVEGLVCFGIPSLMLLFPVWFVSAVVVVDNSSLKLTRLYGVYRREIEWNDIESIQPYDMGAGMRLTSREGKSVTFSSQMTRYPAIVEMLSKVRPDLFNAAGVKIFRKSFFWKYWWFFFLIPATVMFMGSIFVPPFLHSILLGWVLFLVWKTTLHAVHAVQVQDNRLSAKSFRKNVEFTAQQIRNINVVTTRNLKGVPKKWVQIELNEGDDLMLSGFPEGIEVMYGFLTNWWNAYKTA
jgi:hypothetical protein